MAYATVDQVKAEFKDIAISATTNITTDDVTRFIEEADAEIDGKLSSKYVTPITGSVALIIVRQISIFLVSQRIKDINKVKTGVTAANQGSRGNERQTRLDEMARNMLNDIMNEKILLTDATLLNSSDGVSSYNVTNSISPQFERDTDQW